jgi:hypothetical protein
MAWCQIHPTYQAKGEPTGTCQACWRLYFYKNPEAKEVLKRTYQGAVQRSAARTVDRGWLMCCSENN